MIVYKIIFVSSGAVLGALLRWGLGAGLNHLSPNLPLGTLLANLSGAYLIGLLSGWLLQQPQWDDPVRLLLITGFLGAFTTFSSFSLESVLLLQRGEWGWAFGHMLAHLLGSIVLTFAGFATYRWLAG